MSLSRERLGWRSTEVPAQRWNAEISEEKDKFRRRLTGFSNNFLLSHAGERATAKFLALNKGIKRRPAILAIAEMDALNEELLARFDQPPRYQFDAVRVTGKLTDAIVSAYGIDELPVTTEGLEQSFQEVLDILRRTPNLFWSKTVSKYEEIRHAVLSSPACKKVAVSIPAF